LGFLSLNAEDFIHPEKVQTNTRKYRGLFLAHRLYLLHTVLLMLESLRT
jgi:hypothetical protein